MFYEVIHDDRETANKCTVAPLAGRPDFTLMPAGRTGRLGPLRASVLLHHEGRCLTELRDEFGARAERGLGPNERPAALGIATIDCVWKRLDGLLKRIEGPLPTRAKIPDGFITAYPRRNAQGEDPEGGLATIEAIFIAAALLGHWDLTLLSKYYFGRSFIELNTRRFQELGAYAPPGVDATPLYEAPEKTSRARRAGRGQPA